MRIGEVNYVLMNHCSAYTRNISVLSIEMNLAYECVCVCVGVYVYRYPIITNIYELCVSMLKFIRVEFNVLGVYFIFICTNITVNNTTHLIQSK